MNALAALEKYTQLGMAEFSKIHVYSEIAWVLLVYLISYLFASKLKSNLPLLRGESSGSLLNRFGSMLGQLLSPLLVIFFLRISLELSYLLIEQGWVLNVAIAIAFKIDCCLSRMQQVARI